MLDLAKTYGPLGGLDRAPCRRRSVDAWLADQRRSAEDGTFFAACNYYAYIARRP